MVKRDFSQLAVYSINQEVETLPLECLHHLYLNYPSETVYIVKDQKLYGIVTMGEVLYGQKGNSLVRINRSFTTLKGYEAIEAYRIFQEKPQIQKLPVINEAGELIGDYSRWDDMLYIEHNQERIMQKELVEKVLSTYEAVYIVEPVDKKNPQYLELKQYLDSFKIIYIILNKEQICEKLTEKSICIFLNEDERRGMQCLYGLAPRSYDSRGYNTFRYDYLVDKRWQVRLATYKSLILQLMWEAHLNRLDIKKPEHLLYERLDEKATVLLRELSSRGIRCLCLSSDAREETEYGKNFKKEIDKRIKDNTWRTGIVWQITPHSEKFYGDLLQLEDYQTGKAQREILHSDACLGYKEKMTGKYYNIVNGRRMTCNQLTEYIGTIYLVGLCVISGAYVEDQYTIASCLQQRLLEKGYPYRVENYGMEVRFDVENRLEEIGEYAANDLVIFHSWVGEALDVPDISLEEIFERNQIPCDWVKDAYGHCNHTANRLISDALFEVIEPQLSLKKVEEDSDKKLKINFREIMKEYVQQKYLDSIFSEFPIREKNLVGAVVMKANPFNLGHRYLIEQARAQVDLLVIFVLEDDTFLFPFEERLELLKEGTRDIDNIMIVPSGDFIMSRNNFPAYYSQQWDARVPVNAEYDISVFADYIAEPLHITHRFAGAEPKGKIKKIYYETMRKLLPQKGISFVEIPRKKVAGDIVSTSMVQKYLEDKEYDKAFGLLPKSSKKYLLKQFNLIKEE